MNKMSLTDEEIVKTHPDLVYFKKKLEEASTEEERKHYEKQMEYLRTHTTE